jgi:hypothetical protein
MSVQLRADLFNFANHTNFWLFNGSDVLSNIGGAGNACVAPSGGALVPVAACKGAAFVTPTNPTGQIAGLDVTTGKYYGSNGQVLTLQSVQHGRVSNNLNSQIFNGLADPGGSDIPRQAQFSIKVTF